MPTNAAEVMPDIPRLVAIRPIKIILRRFVARAFLEVVRVHVVLNAATNKSRISGAMPVVARKTFQPCKSAALYLRQSFS
jgi:hypothetical protein